MKMLARSVSLLGMLLGLAAIPLAAQAPNARNFQWYLGGYGGAMGFNTTAQDKEWIGAAGMQLMVKARRTGLLLSVEQGFGDDEATAGYSSVVVDSAGNVVSADVVPVTFDYIRKYSAMLMAFPVRGPIAPYVGIGVGIVHAGGYNDGGNGIASSLGSSGFGSLIGGVEIEVSRLSVFGQYQVTTGPGTRSEVTNFTDGSARFDSGKFLSGAIHTFSAGLRINLGNARESVTTSR